MNSHNAKSGTLAANEVIQIETDRKDVRVLRSRLADASALAIADDYDDGGDPYNSTGQHVVIELKKEAAE